MQLAFMSAENTDLASRLPARFPRWKRVLVKSFFLNLALLVLTVGQVNALADLAAEESVAQATSGARHPQARSQQERDDFTAAYALNAAAAEEAAANDFAARYPASGLRHYLYSSAMLQYQRANNPAKMLAMGEKVLELDPDNPLALVLTATALADVLGDRDRDREKKMGTIKRNATRAIQTAEAGYATPLTDTDATSAVYKTTLQSMAYSALGIMKLKTGDDAGAEKDLKTAADLPKVRPDPYIWYHLALAQDHRKKYAAALSSVEQALQLASSDPELQRLAEVEHERLAGLAKSPRNEAPPGPQ
jgi:tetratricopeptide (TPR) repeat protein